MIQPTVDGSKIQRPPVDAGSLSSTIIYDGFKNIPGGCLEFLNHQQY